MEAHIEEVPSTKRDKGFTLVELLIVIVILGILATVTVFAVRGITDKGQENACSADFKTLEVAAESYFANFGGDTIAVDDPGTVAVETIPGSDPAINAGATPEQTLVNAELLRGLSSNYDLSADGLTLTGVGQCA